jgi:hypothetical protein
VYVQFNRSCFTEKKSTKTFMLLMLCNQRRKKNFCGVAAEKKCVYILLKNQL